MSRKPFCDNLSYVSSQDPAPHITHLQPKANLHFRILFSKMRCSVRISCLSLIKAPHSFKDPHRNEITWTFSGKAVAEKAFQATNTLGESETFDVWEVSVTCTHTMTWPVEFCFRITNCCGNGFDETTTTIHSNVKQQNERVHKVGCRSSWTSAGDSQAKCRVYAASNDFVDVELCWRFDQQDLHNLGVISEPE